MVKSVSSFTRHGLRDWLWQRISALVLAVYTLFLVGYILLHPSLEFVVWQGLFQHIAMQVFSLMALLSLVIHAWIGIWTVITDYIKPTGLRLCIQSLVMLTLTACLIWGVIILFGV